MPLFSGDQWCDVHGLVPAVNVSSSSIILIFARVDSYKQPRMNQQQPKGDYESWKQNWQHPKNAAVIRQQISLKNQVTKLYLLPELPANTVAQSTHCFFVFIL